MIVRTLDVPFTAIPHELEKCQAHGKHLKITICSWMKIEMSFTKLCFLQNHINYIISLSRSGR